MPNPYREAYIRKEHRVANFTRQLARLLATAAPLCLGVPLSLRIAQQIDVPGTGIAEVVTLTTFLIVAVLATIILPMKIYFSHGRNK